MRYLLFRSVACTVPCPHKYEVGIGATVDPIRVDRLAEDDDVLPIAGGLSVIHMPGHCAGQVAILWPEYDGVLFAADVCMTSQDFTIEQGERTCNELRTSTSIKPASDMEVLSHRAHRRHSEESSGTQLNLCARKIMCRVSQRRETRLPGTTNTRPSYGRNHPKWS
jgi:hypothetical protein